MGVILERKKRILLNEPHLVTSTPAGIANFSTDLIAPLKSCKVEFSPVQSGSGDPSPNNVRPISGRTGCNVTRCGKNRLSITANMEIKSVNTGYDNTLPRDTTPGILYPNISSNNYWLGTKTNAFVQEVQNGGLTFQSNDSAYGVGTFVPVIPQMTYKISYTDVNSKVQMRIGYYDINGYFTGTYRIIGNGEAFTAPSNVYNAIIVATPKTDYRNQLITISNLQLELGSIVTPYEPYTGSTIPITWSSAGTIYGGYVDLIAGKVVKTTARISLDGSADWQAVGNKFYCPLPYTDYQESTDTSAQACNMYPFAEVIYYGSAVVTQNKHFYLQRHDEYINYCRVWVYDTGYSLSQFKALLNQTPLVFTYPVTESVVSLDPIELKTLRGVNNIWSDTNGNITVKYWAH